MTTGRRSTKKRAISSTEAYASLQSRRRRLERRKTGPPSLVFGPREIESVRVLAGKGKSQETLAHLSGLTTKKFREAMEKDETLREAWLLGKAERREARIAELEKQSKGGNVRATELLLRYEHRDAGPTVKQEGGTTININASSVAAQIDGRKFTAMLERMLKKREPTVIEHEPIRTEPVDPVRAALDRQKQEKHG
jgi:hypothetical protein